MNIARREKTPGEQNLILLEKLFPVNDKFYVWCYAPDNRCIATSCPKKERSLLEQAFRLFQGPEKAEAYVRGERSDLPMIIGSPIGMQWALTQENDHKLNLLYVIGPIFYSMPDEKQLRRELQNDLLNSEAWLWVDQIIGKPDILPVMSFDVFSRYVVMVHNTLTGQRISVTDLFTSRSVPDGIQLHPAEGRDRSKVYKAEQAMLQMVRTGDINYQNVLSRSISLSPGVPVKGQDPLRQTKTSIIVFTSLVCRAAMEGGLSPEVAYSLGDSYIQTVENCRDSGELSALANAMYHDFIYRVHYLHANPNYSHAIQKCCDYIELSLDRKIRSADLAELVGYTEYYLTDKFKKETGFSVSEYIRHTKIERAKLLLRSTSISVQQVSERLAFNTPNYFIQCFREQEGITPAVYRKKSQKQETALQNTVEK